MANTVRQRIQASTRQEIHNEFMERYIQHFALMFVLAIGELTIIIVLLVMIYFKVK